MKKMTGLLMQTVCLAAFCLVGSHGFANPPSASLNQTSPALKTLGSTWKTHTALQPQLDQNDILVGYAGQDVARRTALADFITTS